MAWGIFNKIKKGLTKTYNAGKKAIGAVAKVARVANDKFIKPALPVIKGLANHFVPGAGAIIEEASDGIERYTNKDGSANYKAAKNDVRSWARNQWN